MIKSPCKSICKLDPVSELCLSCGRSLSEITNWVSYSEEEKEKIIKKLNPKGRQCE